MPHVICIYKWNEKRAKQLEPWLKADKERYAIFLEDEPSLLLSLPQTRQLKIVSPMPESLQQIAWEFVFLPFTYEGDHPVLTELARIQAMINYLAVDYADQGATLYQNFKENLLNLQYNAYSFFGKYKNIPAIICGAGPSLAKNGKMLKQFQDKGMIFAGGAALEALRSLGVTPHFGAHVDADPKHTFSSSEVPLFYQLRTSYKSLQKSKGPKILAPGNGNFALETWVQKQLGMDTAPFDSGWTVATFCTALAMRMGCNPIIFVGMDFSTNKKHQYAPGVKAAHAAELLIPIKNQKGETLFSRYDWVLAAEWIEQLAKINPETNFINATEGGLGFKGIVEKKLSEILLPIQEDLKFEGLTPLNEGKEILSKIELSILSCLDLIQNIMKEVEKIFPFSPLESGAIALLEHQLDEELFCQTFLHPAWEVWQHVFKRHSKEGIMSLFLNKVLFYQNLLKTFAPHAVQSVP